MVCYETGQRQVVDDNAERQPVQQVIQNTESLLSMNNIEICLATAITHSIMHERDDCIKDTSKITHSLMHERKYT